MSNLHILKILFLKTNFNYLKLLALYFLSCSDLWVIGSPSTVTRKFVHKKNSSFPKSFIGNPNSAIDTQYKTSGVTVYELTGCSTSRITMKYIYILLVIPTLSYGEVYKCISQDGKASFFDKPCPSSDSENILHYKSHNWSKLLEQQKPDSIDIEKIKLSQDGTIISYKYDKKSSSSAFMRQVNKISGGSVTLLKSIQPINGENGFATLKVTNKKKSLFNRVK